MESGSREKREIEEMRKDGGWGWRAEGGVPPGRAEGSSQSWSLHGAAVLGY